MNMVAHAWDISLIQTLELLDGPYKKIADGVADGRYSFWLGSGISRDRFPMLEDLVIKVLEFLREKISPGDENCPYYKALNTALGFAGLNHDEREQADYNKPVSEWTIVAALKTRLPSRYETLLDIEVDTCANDVLVWDGIDVVGTYGDETIEPDAEHLCLAILMKEGVISELASANWDGLVEKAMTSICRENDPLSVVVKSTDLQNEPNKPKLVKFHGCAIRAKADESTYRRYIVGRGSQIASWASTNRLTALADHLKNTISSHPTLMLGLSVQDFNIQGLFAEATGTLAWVWPGERPSFVFSEQDVSQGQINLLKIVYGEDVYQGDARSQIQEASKIKAFAKPLLLALILYIFTEKTIKLSMTLPAISAEAMATWVRDGLVAIRNNIALADNDNHLFMTESLIKSVSQLRRLASVGQADFTDQSYEPITPHPVSKIIRNIDTQSNGMPEASCALAILGQGIKNGYWSIANSGEYTDDTPMAIINSENGNTPLFIAMTTIAEQNLYKSGRLKENENAILIRSSHNYDKLQRSPFNVRGRTGKAETRIISVADLLQDNPTPDKLMLNFRAEAAL